MDQSRFAYLLQPIRDLTKNWDIDVASQLEEYISEIEQITISFDQGANKMNFAEAALLIQGSTCVYSKKVEYLYAMVYQTLDLIASKRQLAQASSVDDRGRDTDTSFAHRREEELLALDDLEVGANIDMVEGNRGLSFKSVSTVPRTPMSLIPLQESEKASSTPLLSKTGELLGSKLDFKMNTSSVHCSGALLLEPVNQLVLEVKLQNKEPFPLTFDTPAEKLQELLTPTAPSDVFPAMEGGMEDQGMVFPEDAGGGYSDDEGGGFECLPTPTGEKSAASQKTLRRSARVRVKRENKMEDPWKLLDPHHPAGTAEKKPFKKGTTYRIPSSLRKPTSRKRKKSVSIAPSEPLAQFILKSFYSCSSMFPKNPLKAPHSSEFEGAYWAEQKARKTQKQKENATLSRLHRETAVSGLEQETVAGEAGEEDNVEDYQPLGQDYDDDDYAAAGGDFPAAVDQGFEGAFDAFPEQQLSTSFQGVEPMALDGVSGEQAPVVQSYEDLVRNYVVSDCTLGMGLRLVSELTQQ